MSNNDIVYIKGRLLLVIYTISITFRAVKDSYIYPFYLCNHEVKQMEEKKGYKGWENYETWVVKLWMDNDESIYNYWRERAKDIMKEKREFEILDVSAEIKDFFDEENPLEEAGVYTNLLCGAIGNVCWDEIAESILNEVKDNE